MITFYSYKGGTGRSMALANVACYLARKYRVLAIDWDLDAPGLGEILQPILDRQRNHGRGWFEFFENWMEEARRHPSDLHGYSDAFG